MSNTTRALLVVIVLASLLGLPWLERPFHTRGEPREALVAQAMLTTGNWISPPSYDGAVPSKPPFSHWLIALTSLPYGKVTEASSRLPSAVAVVIFAAAFFLVIARRVSALAAFSASLILLSSSEWFRSASTCRVDTILATSMAGAMLALFVWWERGFRGLPLMAILLTTISALTKGPIGIALPLGVFGLFCWTKRGFAVRAIPAIAARCVAIAIPVVAIVSIWYILGYRERGDLFLEKVMYENVDRFTSQMADEPHKHSVIYLLGMLLLGLLPWTVFLVVVGIKERALRWAELKRRWSELPELYQYAVIAAAAVISFFCVPSSKRSVYLLPAYPFLALVIERLLTIWNTEDSIVVRRLDTLVRMIVGLVVIAFCMLLFFPLSNFTLTVDAFVYTLTPWKMFSSLALIVSLAVLTRALARHDFMGVFNRLSVTVVMAVWCVSFSVYDTVATQLSPKRWLQSEEFRRQASMSDELSLYSFGSEMYGASFYLERQFSRLVGAPPAQSLVFMEQKRVDEFASLYGATPREVSRYSSGVERPSKDIVVFENRSLTPLR